MANHKQKTVRFRVQDIGPNLLAATVAQTAATLALLSQEQGKSLPPNDAVLQAMDWVGLAAEQLALELGQSQ